MQILDRTLQDKLFVDRLKASKAAWGKYGLPRVAK
jgi:hypothetical protein